MTTLQYLGFSSAVGVGFWHQLAQLKLDVFKLDESPRTITGHFTLPNLSHEQLPSQFFIDSDSFDPNYPLQNGNVVVKGRLINFNTIENFQSTDKSALFNAAAKQIWDDIVSGAALKDVRKLFQFQLLTFADLKKFKFYYWFSFPAFSFDVKLDSAPVPLSQILSDIQMEELRTQHLISGFPAVFIWKLNNSNNSIQLTSDLSQLESFSKDQKKLRIGFVDPCSMPSNPGWPLRNVLLLLAKQFNISECEVICFREQPKQQSRSIVLSLQLPSPPKEMPSAVGWEKNAQNQLAPRFISLGTNMDPLKLASSAVDLNLKLMKWRLMPQLDLERVTSTKCLLLGAGTLGCNVARCLMGWGIKNITLVDSGNVSYSNPVRQSLFEYEDCLKGGQPKAETAAAHLKKIFPGMNTLGINMSIPMPGHPIGNDGEEVNKTVNKLVDLISSHDVVYLLMDSRESRWLPTMLCSLMNKPLINVGLGFDSFVVMRHGIKNSEKKQIDQLGCYFCNDVVAPQNSLKDRTLDQQCTVTRPGLSYIASALGVELLVSCLHHPKGFDAPAEEKKELREETSSVLGVVPHTVRGFLSHFSEVLIKGHAYDKCVGCSEIVKQSYQKDGFQFLTKVFNDPLFLEELTGIAAMKKSDVDLDVEWETGEKEEGKEESKDDF